MPIIIDGWNMIRSPSSKISDDEGDSLDSAAMLITCLKDFQSTKKDPILVVFDSSSGHLNIGYRNTPLLRVVATQDADDYIKRYLDALPRNEKVNSRVVSSDKDVYFYARSSSAIAVTSEAFWAKLNR